ncbi:unnamed protein product [Ostreobium quekettii]|uniref:Rubisco LSMT substrate-binding domain-containing protein n=1 Tax=Ostreobium quekettii TaxID=121088 RepID=A0A8S1IM22_9CHLO|nr:unnamed protein product [Ostreobium quekettii]|eukprot:evm.model.scf_291.5 EVM.evm.TU.scf_291.5   scf_291:41484-45032(+)
MGSGAALEANFDRLEQWLPKLADAKSVLLQRKAVEGRVAFVTTRDVRAGEVVLQIPGDVAVTAADAAGNEDIGELTTGRSPLVCMALWLMAEQSRDASSSWYPLLQTLPESTLSPLLWSENELKWLSESEVLQQTKSRVAALRQEWEALSEVISRNPKRFPPDIFGEQEFRKAFSVVLACSTYLPSAQCFALLPVVSALARTGHESGCTVDYNADLDAVVVTASKSYRGGEEVSLYYDQPNGERLLALGSLEEQNPSDFLSIDVELVPSDGLFRAKKQILEGLGLQAKQSFPIYEDKMPAQLLSYLRLSRVQDAAQLAKVRFDEDAAVSQMNEYEVLQLLMGECRTRLAAYDTTIEEDVKALQKSDMDPKQRLATQLILGEKNVWQGTMTAVRSRLAPIRGIPTKNGLSDPNEDILELFSTIESLPNKPKQMLDGFVSWAKGEQGSKK